MAFYLAALRGSPRPLPSAVIDAEQSNCSAWGGLGGVVLVSASSSSTGAIPEPLWNRFRASVELSREGDFFGGYDGAMPVLAQVPRARTHDGLELVRSVHRRGSERLLDLLHAHQRREPVRLGLAHGIAGCLLSHEIGNALLGLDESALRADAIDLLLGARLPRGKDFVWPTTSGDSKPGLHALCNGAPGVALAALLGARYSRRTVRAIDRSGHEHGRGSFTERLILLRHFGSRRSSYRSAPHHERTAPALDRPRYFPPGRPEWLH